MTVSETAGNPEALERNDPATRAESQPRNGAKLAARRSGMPRPTIVPVTPRVFCAPTSADRPHGSPRTAPNSKLRVFRDPIRCSAATIAWPLICGSTGGPVSYVRRRWPPITAAGISRQS